MATTNRMKYEVFTDGSIGPINPGGTAAYGVYILKPDGSPHEDWGVVGRGDLMSNNVAEYAALGKALALVKDKFDYKNSDIECYSDSQLVVYQMSGKWRLGKGSGLYLKEAARVALLASEFPHIQYNWIPREKNIYADALSKRALKEAGVNEWSP